ncbi:MAG: phosphoribosylamine--glycine ligase [Deltaproteobacteria bacterium]|nr:phosphoribosylamine--glycine ligase [Deltaproteobacteria bacterium]
MRLLVVGGGGREHALVWKLRQSKKVSKIYAIPGNGGIGEEADLLLGRPEDLEGIVTHCRGQKIDFVVVGPELPLTLGLVDRLEREKIPCFGPSRQAAELEGSKAFTKQLLREEKIPTAHFETFSDFDRAVDFLKSQAYPIVIKADGLAAGKGVLICKDRSEAVGALEKILKKRIFGGAGERVVIEEFLKGEEVSFHVLVDGEQAVPLATAQDYKRVRDGDEGPNTGGMGATTPNQFFSPDLEKVVLRTIIRPTIEGLKRRGIIYRGVLYAGLMLTSSGPRLLEYNVRFGDPETQVLMARLDSDLMELMEYTMAGRLDRAAPVWKKEVALTVVLAAHGYPDEVCKGDEIAGLEKAKSVLGTVVFHAGTRKEEGRWLTNGGRVLGVTSWGKDLRQARERAYDACDKIYWKGVHYRKDIGLKGSL